MSETTGNSRRSFLGQCSAGAVAGLAASMTPASRASAAETKPTKFRYCLNTSCIREAKLPLPELIQIAADAGYDGIEPWIGEIDRFVAEGGKLSDARKQLKDANLQVESAIGFPRWAVDDDAERAAGVEEAKRCMDLVRQLGGKRIAAPPAGINSVATPIMDLMQIATRYRALLQVGEAMEVIPQVEIWGSSRNLHHLAQAAFVAMAADHPKAAILPDIYHLYRGGSDFNGLRLLSGEAIQIFHMNDYPANPPREKTRDSDRVYPGDGVAPLDMIIQSLQTIGFSGVLSLELFNPEYYRQDPAQVAKIGLQKMRESVRRALA